MTESLTIANSIELLGGGVASAIPEAGGVTFLLRPGYDLGAPGRAAENLVSVLLDGERPLNPRRAGNRQITLPVKIIGPDRTSIAAAREKLLFATDHDPWHLTWSRDGTLPMVYDCFHAETIDMGYDLTTEQQYIYMLDLTFQALPYGRSETPAVVEFTSPLSGKTAPPGVVTIDAFNFVFNRLLVGDSAHFSDSLGVWGSANVNCATAYDSAVSFAPPGSMKMTSSAAGNMSAAHCAAANILTQGLACRPDDQVQCGAWLLAATAGRNCQAGANFYDASGVFLSTILGTAVGDNTIGWTQVAGVVTAPPKAARASLVIQVNSAGGAGEIHHADEAFLQNLTGGAEGWQVRNQGTASVHHFIASAADGAGIQPGQRFQLYGSGTIALKEATVFTVASVSTPFAGFQNVEFTPNAAAIVAFNDVAWQTDWTLSAAGPGASSAYWSTGTSGAGIPAVFSRSNLSVNLTGLPALTIWAGFASTSFYQQWALRHSGHVTFTFTLSDGTTTIRFSVIQPRVDATNDSSSPRWQKIRVPIPQGTALNYAAVTAYSVKVTNNAAGDLRYTDLYLSELAAVPVTRQQASQPRSGYCYDIAGVTGTARSPMSLQVMQPAGVYQQITKRFTAAGGQAWLCPANVPGWVYAQWEAAGGKGGKATGGAANFTAGGGGGEGAGDVLAVTPGSMYPLTVPAGGNTASGRAGSASFTHDNGTVTAQGGGNVADGSITGGTAGGPAYTPREQLSGDTSGFEGGNAQWTGAGNCTISNSTAQAHSGTHSLAQTSSAAGDMIVASVVAANIQLYGDPCRAGVPVTVNAFSRAATAARSVQTGAEFYDINGASLGQLFGSSVTNSTANFTTNPTATLTPPAGSVWLRRLGKVLATGAASEVHYWDDWSLKVGYAQAGGTGGAGNNTGTVAGGGGGGGGGTTAAGTNGTAGASGGGGGAAGTGCLGTGTGGAGGVTATGAYAKPGKQAGGGGGGQIGSGDLTTVAKGAPGQVNLTWLQTPQFKTLVVHRPGPDIDDSFSPFVPVDRTDVPDGTTEYPVPSQTAGSQARFGSTFTVYAVNYTWHTPASARTVTVAVKHYEQQAGAVYTQTISRSVTPNNLASQLVNLGELTIPDHMIPDGNTQAYFTITVTSGDTADRFQDVLFLDTRGSTVIIESPTAYTSYWIDEPATDRSIGFIGGSQFDRNDAVSVLQYAKVSGPPLHVDPLGSSQLLLYCADQLAPTAEMTYFARWILDRAA